MKNCVATMEVKQILDSEDNIISQLQKLRKYNYKKGVRQYIDRLISATRLFEEGSLEEYVLYCIVKYYYGLKVEEVKEPLPKLLLINSNDFDVKLISNLLESKDNIIEQCKLLREHKDVEDVQTYISRLLEWYDCDMTIANISREFEIYCINKYFYNLDIEEEQPKHIKLYAYIKPKKKESRK